MATYIALLRGVNIGGNTLKMERLRKLCADLGHADIQTYVQSGNVIFNCKVGAAACTKALEQKLVGETRLPVTVIVRTPAELKKVLSKNPFPEPAKRAPGSAKQKSVEPIKLYVAFLAAAPTQSAIKTLEELNTGQDQFHLAGKEIYLHYFDGYGNSKMNNNLFEKLLSVRATTRNWNTVNKLYEMTTEE